MKKILITYFSASGQTTTIAKAIALGISKTTTISSDVLEIIPKEKYTAEDLNWTNKKSRSSLEMADKASRPAIIKQDIDLNLYDTILIGFPIWWYTAPTIINTFLESYDLHQKEIILFATSGGSSIKKSLTDLQQQYPAYKIVEGVLCNTVSDIKKIAQILTKGA